MCRSPSHHGITHRDFLRISALAPVAAGLPGVILFLLELHHATGSEAYLEEARRGADHLMALVTSGKLIHPGLYTGVAYFLARLYEVTGDQDLLDGALQGASYLTAASRNDGRGSLIFHHEPEGEDLFYVSGDDVYLTFVDRIERYLTDQCEEDDSAAGTRWVQAETRTQPESVVAQTGWMQGAAGVGAFFVHLDGKRKGRPDRILPPDSPWRCVTPVTGGGGGGHVA